MIKIISLPVLLIWKSKVMFLKAYASCHSDVAINSTRRRSWNRTSQLLLLHFLQDHQLSYIWKISCCQMHFCNQESSGSNIVWSQPCNRSHLNFPRCLLQDSYPLSTNHKRCPRYIRKPRCKKEQYPDLMTQ